LILHLLEYRVVPGHEAEVVSFQRHNSLVTPFPAGLTALSLGRRLSGHGRKHLAVTAWTDPAALANGTDSDSIPAFLVPGPSLLGDTAARQYRVVASTGLGREGARVLRVYRTSIVAAKVEHWEQRTLENVDRIAVVNGNLWALAGVEIDTGATGAAPQTGQVCIVVLTAWQEWDLLLAATGGRLNRALIDTELVELEMPATADHFELLEAESGPE
jgi:hypothetical protein